MAGGGDIHIVLASDANYRPGLEVAQASILAHCATPTRLVWHVFDEHALDTMPGVADLPKWNGSLMPYLRLWLPALLPDVDWVVYTDVDTIWCRDICALTPAPTIAWVRDFRSMRIASQEWISRVAAAEGCVFDWSRYACSGVCVLNLKRMREMNFTQRVLDLYARHGVPPYPDQDVLNYLFNADSVLLPSVWCAMGDPYNLPPAHAPYVFHLTGVGRHFHDATPPLSPPQYLAWWRWRHPERPVSAAESRARRKYRFLAALYPLRALLRLLPLTLCERITRQLFFARNLLLVDASGQK